jgi:hypothetical protein
MVATISPAINPDKEEAKTLPIFQRKVFLSLETKSLSGVFIALRLIKLIIQLILLDIVAYFDNELKSESPGGISKRKLKAETARTAQPSKRRPTGG